MNLTNETYTRSRTVVFTLGTLAVVSFVTDRRQPPRHLLTQRFETPNRFLSVERNCVGIERFVTKLHRVRVVFDQLFEPANVRLPSFQTPNQ